jgi:hypothetical protein
MDLALTAFEALARAAFRAGPYPHQAADRQTDQAGCQLPHKMSKHIGGQRTGLAGTFGRRSHRGVNS